MGDTYGVVTGEVVSVDDRHGEGRVRVKFRWLGGNNEGYWAPVASLMAGPGRGTWFMPREGDECLVAFDKGAVNHPYIIGFLWNGQDRPPETNPNKRMIKSVKGHVITLDDSDGGEKIVVTSKSGLTITLDDTPGEEKIQLEGGGRRLVMSQGRVDFY
jgi:uncharacterized protein involved in type VI secretion and phage assembly